MENEEKQLHMKSVLSTLYNNIMTDNREISHTKCFICKDDKMQMYNHYSEHNDLNKKIWEFDYSASLREDSPFAKVINFGDYGCKVCNTGSRAGIIAHYIKYHPNVIRFLYEGNVKVI